eukprot:TRINITY_DN26411_c0_g1_i2.p1 TRINITY_DN26411_c0_g1~~TRINITY_DN26411_c0_g1_i2.p1  ORF type:complete len:590 (-),score=131.79 TRINITY_DN26411_c0_g1_i2:262-2031(-)
MAAAGDPRDRLLSVSTASTTASAEDLERSAPICDVEQAAADQSACADFQICFDRNCQAASRAAWAYLAAFLLGLVACAGFLTLAARSTSYITYMLLFALLAPASYYFRFLIEKLRALERQHCIALISICVHSKYERHLMEGLRWQLARTRGLENGGEAVVERQENAHGTASLEVQIRPICRVLHLTLQRAGRCERLRIQLNSGENGGLPGSAQLQIRASGKLRFLSAAWSGAEVAAQIAADVDDKRKFLHSWLQHVYADYMRTSTGMIEVYELTKEHVDHPLAWTRVRQERSVSSGGVGMFTYCASDWAMALKNRAEYAIRHRGKTRVNLFVSGNKGSGKTLFVEWLAAELSLPLYNIDLSSPNINNEVLREVMTPNKLSHNLPVIFHFDEFQSMIEEWSESRLGPSCSRRAKSLVTIQGLQNMLEGTSTPNNAIFVFTSSRALPTLVDVGMDGSEERHEWRGLLRRFPVQVQIPLMGSEQRKDFCRQFLAAYLKEPWETGSSLRELARWNAFEEGWARVREGVPFDMLTKYAQERTQAAYIVGMMTSLPEGCKVKEECRERYLEMFFSPAHVQRWITEYAGNAPPHPK